MKRGLLIALAAVLAAALCGCAGIFSPENDYVYSISLAAFSKETQQVLDALGDDIAFFDYQVDSSVRSFSVDIWGCEGGVWSSMGAISGNIEGKTKGRIGIQYTADNCKVITLDDTGHSSYSSNSGVDFSSVDSTSMVKINETSGWTLNEEMVLLLKTGADADGFHSSSMEDFRERGCEAGIAFTITFYDKTLY